MLPPTLHILEEAGSKILRLCRTHGAGAREMRAYIRTPVCFSPILSLERLRTIVISRSHTPEFFQDLLCF
jgi:hypothetical protein